MANPAHLGGVAHPRLLDLNCTTGGIAAGCLMSLGAPLPFAAAHGAILNDGLIPGDLILVRYRFAHAWHPGEGRLAERILTVHPGRRERLKLPHFCRSA